MKPCQYVRRFLATLATPFAPVPQAVRIHVLRCPRCAARWEAWQRFETRLAHLLQEVPAPAHFEENVMACLATVPPPTVTVPPLVLHASARGIVRLLLAPAAPPPASPLLARAYTQLAEYFRGERAVFQLPVDLSSCTPFVRAVLTLTARIPYGEVRTYKWLAAQLGQPGATRAVGNALRRNPVPILIPCHRVVRSDGHLGGYALGEAWKQRLLALEQSVAALVGCVTTRIVCYRGCRHERRVREGNRVLFSSLAAARASGYRPCRLCQPA